MKRKKNNEIFFFAGVIIVIIIIIAMIMIPGRGPDSDADGNSPAGPNMPPLSSDANSSAPVMPPPVVSPPAATQPAIALSGVIDAADAWMPCAEHKAWVGKAAPDFSIIDIDGKQHALSSYRGKSVIVNLWSPWFTPTHKELETLVQLRRAVDVDKLVILGVSFDSDVTVERFVKKQTSINFPIISVTTQTLPAPYSTAKPYPCSMFITPEGVLKLSARGSITLADFQAILTAE
ncbi:MAG: redoxin domain-containing protein [Planctomycetes bacterium]|nr:redoxin domain-containing protein [Planctomycetota bacterium]